VVKGLDLFRDHFQGNTDPFVLIGGTACDVLMSQAGVPFRATKDLDIVLLIEALTPDFGRLFWEFIRKGGYAAKERESGAKQYYRFSKPSLPEYPVLLELFSSKPDGLELPEESVLTPIPVGADVSNLSAILLDENYYGYLKTGRKVVQGLPIIGAEHLMALKAKAWLDLSERKARGERVESNAILKHKRDVFRLFQIADPDFSAEIPGIIRQDMDHFLDSMQAEGIDLKSLGINGMDQDEVIDSIRSLFIK
jgi:hypothetical protein